MDISQFDPKNKDISQESCWKLHLETNKAIIKQKLQYGRLQQNCFLFGFKNLRVYVDPHVSCSSCNDSHSGFNGRAVQIRKLLCCDCTIVIVPTLSCFGSFDPFSTPVSTTQTSSRHKTHRKRDSVDGTTHTII